MKILYIAHDNSLNGASKALLNIIFEIKKRHEVRVLCPDVAGMLKSSLESKGIICYTAKFRKTTYPHYNGNPFIFIKTLIGTIYRAHRVSAYLEYIIKEYRPDIVHTNTGTLDIALNKCKKYKIPHVWHLREYQDKDFGLHIIPSKSCWIKKIHQEGNYNIAITKDIFNYFNLRDVDTYIYDGVFDSVKIQLPNNKVRQKYFLFVGRFEESKGLFETLEAFRQVNKRHPDYKYQIAAKIDDSSYYFRCKEFVNNNGLEESVIFLGERNDVYELMASATALIVPSRCEGFGFITVEAMLNGCLVIGRNIGGTKEQFDNGVLWTSKEIGLRFDSIEDLINNMMMPIEHDYSDLCCTAQKVVREKYSNDANVRAIESYYMRIMMSLKKDV